MPIFASHQKVSFKPSKDPAASAIKIRSAREVWHLASNSLDPGNAARISRPFRQNVDSLESWVK